MIRITPAIQADNVGPARFQLYGALSGRVAILASSRLLEIEGNHRRISCLLDGLKCQQCLTQVVEGLRDKKIHTRPCLKRDLLPKQI